ncbi:MAG TPA: hypothetical protein PK156_43205 [Polyangium sp.]|nr:hypothetical protein [Polyangium sp.]
MEADYSWICDTCRQLIENIDEGCVEWINQIGNNKKRIRRDLRLVHRQASPHRESVYECQFNTDHEFQKDRGTVSDRPLEDFLGPNGLISLLAMIEFDNPAFSACVVEMIKRLHIPGYEHARAHFDAAIREGVIEPKMRQGFYSMGQIEATLAFAAERGDE